MKYKKKSKLKESHILFQLLSLKVLNNDVNEKKVNGWLFIARYFNLVISWKVVQMYFNVDLA